VQWATEMSPHIFTYIFIHVTGHDIITKQNMASQLENELTYRYS
jgi:hypothetical protein